MPSPWEKSKSWRDLPQINKNSLVALSYHHLMAILGLLIGILVLIPVVLFVKLCWELINMPMGRKRKSQTHEQDTPHSEDPRFQ